MDRIKIRYLKTSAMNKVPYKRASHAKSKNRVGFIKEQVLLWPYHYIKPCIRMSELHQEISTTDIVYILENPWEKSRFEWLLSTEEERRETLRYLWGRLALTENNGYARLWKTASGRPIALLGAFRAGEKQYETFLICSNHMEEHGMKLSFDMRKILKELSMRYTGCTCGQYAQTGNTAQISWFRFMGFKPKPEGNVGNTLYFEYTSPSI
jgi:hypothetical protein